MKIWFIFSSISVSRSNLIFSKHLHISEQYVYLVVEINVQLEGLTDWLKLFECTCSSLPFLRKVVLKGNFWKWNLEWKESSFLLYRCQVLYTRFFFSTRNVCQLKRIHACKVQFAKGKTYGEISLVSESRKVFLSVTKFTFFERSLRLPPPTSLYVNYVYVCINTISPWCTGLYENILSTENKNLKVKYDVRALHMYV